MLHRLLLHRPRPPFVFFFCFVLVDSLRLLLPRISREICVMVELNDLWTQRANSGRQFILYTNLLRVQYELLNILDIPEEFLSNLRKRQKQTTEVDDINNKIIDLLNLLQKRVFFFYNTTTT